MALSGAVDGINLALAWAYVVLRIVQSVVQSTGNRVIVRIIVFFAATAALLTLATMPPVRRRGECGEVIWLGRGTRS